MLKYSQIKKQTNVASKAAFLILAAAAVLMDGCSRPAAKQEVFVKPPANRPLDDVAREHFLYKEIGSLTSGSLSLEGAAKAPRPLEPSGLKTPKEFQGPDVPRMRNVMNVRLAAINSRIEKNILARELQSAEVEARQLRQKLSPELDAQLNDIKSNFAAQITNAQLEGAGDRQKLKFDIALLKARMRNTPGDTKPIEEQIAQKEKQLESSAAKVSASVQSLRKQLGEAQQQARENHEKRLQRAESNLEAEARQRAEKLSLERHTQTESEIAKFLDGLQRPDISVNYNMTALKAPADSSRLIDSRTNSAVMGLKKSLQSKILVDARVADILSRVSYKDNSSKIEAKNRAKRLVTNPL